MTPKVPQSHPKASQREPKVAPRAPSGAHLALWRGPLAHFGFQMGPLGPSLGPFGGVLDPLGSTLATPADFWLQNGPKMVHFDTLERILVILWDGFQERNPPDRPRIGGTAVRPQNTS